MMLISKKVKGRYNMVSITVLKSGEIIQGCSSIEEGGRWLRD